MVLLCEDASSSGLWKYEVKSATGCIWLGAKQMCYRGKDGSIVKHANRGLSRNSAANKDIINWETFKAVLEDSFEAPRPFTKDQNDAYLDYMRALDVGKGQQKLAGNIFQPSGINSSICEKFDHLMTTTLQRKAMDSFYAKRKVDRFGIFTFTAYIGD